MGEFIPRFQFWNPGTWAIPQLYWDSFSNEQRFHAICKQLGKVIAYSDYLGVNVDNIAARLKAIEDGQLDPYIIAEIEQWFEDNQPAIVQALSDLADADTAILGMIGTGFTDADTVADHVTALETLTTQQGADITKLMGAHLIADDDLKIRVVDVVNGNDDTAHAVASYTDTSAMYATLQKAFDDAIFEGSDVRIAFNCDGNYTLQTRIIAGAVIHMMANANASGDINVSIGNPNYGSLFFYDTHWNVTGTPNAYIRVTVDHQIECEGSSLWTNWSEFTCELLYLIQGSFNATHATFNCPINLRYVQGRFIACVFANKSAADQINAACSIIRFEADSTPTACTVMENPNGTGYDVLNLYTCQVYGALSTLDAQNQALLSYKYFWHLHSALAFVSNSNWESYKAYAQSGNQIEQMAIQNGVNKQEQMGYESGVTVPATGYTDVAITYNMEFYQTPYVHTQLQIGSGTDPNLSDVSAFVMNRTINGCTIRLFNNYSSDKVVTVMWKAEI